MCLPVPLKAVLEQYPGLDVRQVQSLGGAGGYSGAAFWKIHRAQDLLCLRRWPREHPTPERLHYIHSVLCHLADSGFRKLPVPERTRRGATFVESSGYLWELTSWLSGKADFHAAPTVTKLMAAMRELAHFHQAAITYESRVDFVPGIQDRSAQVVHLVGGGLRQIADRLLTVPWPEFRPRAEEILQRFQLNSTATSQLLSLAGKYQVSVQPCIRDIWHDHVLFLGEEVSGFVDFGALQSDHVATDIARLLGSLVTDDRNLWKTGLDAYQTVRPLAEEELLLVDAYDRSSTLLSGINWLTWIAVERREFDDKFRVLRRLDDILQRLRRL